MIVLALAALVASAPPPSESPRGGATPLVQATATVRIIPGARITAGEVPKDAIVRNTQMKGPDGVRRDARLVEFP